MFIQSFDAAVIGGITPLFSSPDYVRENSDYSVSDIKSLYRFLFNSGLSDLPAEIFDAVADLVYKAVSGKSVLMRDVYSDISKHGKSNDATRSQMTYHIKKSYSYIRDSVMLSYRYDIGKEYGGNKNFIYKMSIVYRVFARFEVASDTTL